MMSLSCSFYSFSLFVLLINSANGLMHSSPDVSQEYCTDETFEAECRGSSVIMMQEAKYGRMQLGGCLDQDFGYIDCYDNLLEVMDQLCSGRKNCKEEVADLWRHHGEKPCHKDLASYLQAKYTCVETHKGDDNGECCRSKEKAELTSRSGMIASISSTETGCGSNSCPWLIKAEEGQVINLALTDFSVYSYNSYTHTSCNVLLVVKEGTKTKSICAEGVRENSVYTSKGSQLEIRIVENKKNKFESHFLIEYQVSGCPELQPPSGGWMTRKGDTVQTGCLPKDGLNQVELVCKGHVWKGEIPTCVEEPVSLSVKGVLSGFSNLSPGILALVILCLVAPIVSIIIVICAVIWVRRRYTNYQPRVAWPTMPRGAMFVDSQAGGGLIAQTQPTVNAQTILRGYPPQPGTVALPELGQNTIEDMDMDYESLPNAGSTLDSNGSMPAYTAPAVGPRKNPMSPPPGTYNPPRNGAATMKPGEYNGTYKSPAPTSYTAPRKKKPPMPPPIEYIPSKVQVFTAPQNGRKPSQGQYAAMVITEDPPSYEEEDSHPGSKSSEEYTVPSFPPVAVQPEDQDPAPDDTPPPKPPRPRTQKPSKEAKPVPRQSSSESSNYQNLVGIKPPIKPKPKTPPEEAPPVTTPTVPETSGPPKKEGDKQDKEEEDCASEDEHQYEKPVAIRRDLSAYTINQMGKEEDGETKEDTEESKLPESEAEGS